MSNNKNTVETDPKVIELREGVHMTYNRFLEWLNANFEKKSKKPFIAQDAFGYVDRGHIPYSLGNYSLKMLHYPEIGLKIIEVTELKK